MSRGYKLNRTSYDYVRSERVNWLDQFAEDINNASQCTAVEVSRYRNQLSMHDRINSIMQGNNIHSGKTVEGVVKDMQERVGLKDYLDKVIARRADKTAQNELFANLGKDLQKKLVNFCKNKVATHRGQITVPAIQHEILSSFNGIKPEDINNEKVARFISDIIAKEQKLNPIVDNDSIDLGKGVGVVDVDAEDPDNTDFMKGLMPASE